MLMLPKHFAQESPGPGSDDGGTDLAAGDHAQPQLFGRQPIHDEGTADFAAPLFLESGEVGRPADPAPT